MLEKFFNLSENRTTVKTEILAGVTTFMTMAYILAVNPGILGDAGMDRGAVFTATALSAVIATLVMALVAKLPFALAPGMGLNAFFAYTVVLTMGYSWQFALTAVFLEGVIFIVLTAFNVREMIVNAIPANIRNSISVGIGLFIAFIGLQNSGIIVDNPATLVSLGDMSNVNVILAILGIFIIGVLLAFKVKGALLIGILVATVIGIPMGITHFPEGSLIQTPPSLSPIFFQFEWGQILTVDMLIVLFTFLFVDMFDTVGTLIGVSTKADMLDENGKIPRVKQALFADAIGTFFGSIFGTSTVTTYVESASGVAEGGRTGLTALSTAVLFALALILAPVFLMIPAAALSPVLIIVGLFMMSPVKNIDLEDFTEAIPAFLTIILMPLTYSIADGIIFGMLSFVLLKIFTGKAKGLSILMYILAILFIAKLWGPAISGLFS
ncbi:AGZA family xanthine/uracil permease-like MFS transporter [Balneicella halophila]|uniref:AGZA family xanthine/uracil permease-like MFS transporter n=1 Tax=Balneicella halophila TaxID=1537566 RepID=A0A7L4UR77_BALHA|nr:NCS2 family permease [Balneicella halophila]PVX52278.1 AGZA family xanthine/uracil permease-like MFS transporter [Balneicella halophila]